jgi:hypothetical protein
VPVGGDAERQVPDARRTISGPPKGNQNAYKPYTAEAIARRRSISMLTRSARSQCLR